MTDEHRCSLIDLFKVNNSSSFERNNLKHEMNSVSYNSFPEGRTFCFTVCVWSFVQV